MWAYMQDKKVILLDTLNDISSLREHYSTRFKWYLAAIDRLESDIQILWNDYFLEKSRQTRSVKLLEIDQNFKFLKEALVYFRESADLTKKRLDELDRQEYAIINNNDDPIN